MTAINPINIYSSTPTANQGKKEIGKEQFLEILVAQLQNQDPTQPMKDGEMINQMSQMSVLEQLSNLNNNLSNFLFPKQDDLAQYSSMLDKKVTWTNPETKELESGIVSGVQYKDNLIFFKIGDKDIYSGSILSVEGNKEEVEK